MSHDTTSDLLSSAAKCAELIQQSSRIGVLTGAGVSTGAGIPDFRGPQGLYISKRYDPDTVFDLRYFLEDPQPFYEFARDFIQLEENIVPTLTHCFFARLEEQGKCIGVITQNIDALHQRAGSKNVYEMHGGFWRSFCLNCSEEWTYEEMKSRLLSSPKIPHCSCGGLIKPDVVFFGENVKYLQESAQLAAKCDLFFVVGTSCVVFPAATIPQYTHGKIVVVNQGDILRPWPNLVLYHNGTCDEFFKEVESCLNSV